jgi:hypothetical protein
MNLMPDPEDEAPEPEPQEAIKLDDCYDVCLLGCTLGIEADRYVYSISKLLRYERTRLKVTTAEAREALAEVVTTIQRTAGPLSPVFVNDELVLGDVADEDAITIIKPGDPGFRRPRPIR